MIRTASVKIALIAVAVAVLIAPNARAATSVVIINGNAPGVGFNDPTPVAPVGNNNGTTLGEQRLIAFQEAGNRWGATLDSPQPIRILATFEPLACTATQAVLGSAGARFIYADFGSIGLYPGPVAASTWHGGPLATKRAGVDPDPTEGDAAGTPKIADIRARFNSDLGKPGCLTGIFWYLGLDGRHGNDNDLVAVLLHEFGHGMGFQQFASVTTGQRIDELNDVYNLHILDNTTGKYWFQMSDAERKASAVNNGHVVFDGVNVNAAVPDVLVGTPALFITSPAAIAGTYAVGTASFGGRLTLPGIGGLVVRALDEANAAGPTTGDACTPILNDVSGKIALVDRGTCGFVVKVKNAQNAGATAVIVADNAAGPVAGMGGGDATITIPSVRITLADGNTIKAQLAAGPVTGTVGLNGAVTAGIDNHRALLYTPTAVSPGSTISHWDISAYPNQLMEPFINGDLTHAVRPPEDLTLPLLYDIGWFPDNDLDGLADANDACPASNLGSSVVVGGINTGVANAMFRNGCTINDTIAQIVAGAKNHGGFVSGVAHLLDSLVAQGAITDAEKDRIQSAAAHTK